MAYNNAPTTYTPSPSPRKGSRHKRLKPLAPPHTLRSEHYPTQRVAAAGGPPTATVSLPPGYHQALHAPSTHQWGAEDDDEGLDPARGAHERHHNQCEQAVFSDSPPDYPDSAEEADEETELDSPNDRDSPELYHHHQHLQQYRPLPSRLQLQPFQLSPQHQQSSSTYSPRHQHSYSNPPPHTASPRRQKHFYQQQQQAFGSAAGGGGLGQQRRSPVGFIAAYYNNNVIGNNSTSTPSSPKSHKHKRRHSSTPVLRSRGSTDNPDVDSYLDSLLERSVHALEMSNTLLESSISTRATMNALLTSPEYHSGHAESALEARAIGLSSNMLRNWDAQENWAEQLEGIRKGVDSLFSDETEAVAVEAGGAGGLPVVEAEGSMSKSLPPSSSPLSDFSRRAELVQEQHQKVSSPQLRLAPQDRAALVSPPPRALTMYIDANSTTSSPSLARFHTPELPDLSSSPPTAIMLPATLGKRPSMPSFHTSSSKTRSASNGIVYSSVNASASTSHLPMPQPAASASALVLSPVLQPQLTERQMGPTTPAYSLLSNLAARSSANNLNRPVASSSSNSLAPPSISHSRPVGMNGKQNIRASASAPSSFVSSFLSNVVSLRRRNSSPPASPTPTRSDVTSRKGTSSSKGTRSYSSSTPPHNSSRSSRVFSMSPSSNNSTASLPTSHSRHSSPMLKKRRSFSSDRSSFTARSSPVVQVRQMTPPTEGTDEEASSGSSSSSSSDGSGRCVAKQTVVSLRKILDEMPPPPQPPPLEERNQQEVPVPGEEQCDGEERGRSALQKQQGQGQWRRPPAPLMMPRTAVGPASAGTSTATASISRLLTKGVHTSSTGSRGSPLKSVMKRRGLCVGDGATSPSPSPSTSSSAGFGGTQTPPPPSTTSLIPVSGVVDSAGDGSGQVSLSASTSSLTSLTVDTALASGNLGMLVSRALLKSKATPSNTPPSSGVSTPRRISFAQLPESYMSTKPASEQGSVGRKRSAGRRNRKGGGGTRNGRSESEDVSRKNGHEEGGSGWWSAWLGGAGVDSYGTMGRDRERVEDRATRRLGMSMGMGMHGGGGHLGVLDEWGV